jgi:hypothetical protein
MFGGIAFMINGHMCCGVTRNDLVVRLGSEDGIAALAQPHTRPMDFTGGVMKSMIFVDAAGTASDRALREWVDAALAFVGKLSSQRSALKGKIRSSRSRRTE